MKPRIPAAVFCLAIPATAVAGNASTLSGTSVRPPTRAFAPVVEALSSGDLGDLASVDFGILAPYVGDVAEMAREPGHYGALDAPQAWAEALSRSLFAGLQGGHLNPEAESMPLGVTPRRAATEYVMALASTQGALESYLEAHRDKRSAEAPAREALQDLDSLAGVLRGLDPAQTAAFVARLDRAREVGARFQSSKDPAVLDRFWTASVRASGPGVEPVPTAADPAAELIKVYLDPIHLDGRPLQPGSGRWVEDQGYRELHQSNAAALFPGGRPLGDLIDAPAQLAWFNAVRRAAPELLSHMVRSAMLAGRLILELTGYPRGAFQAMQAAVLHDVGKLEILKHEKAKGELDGSRRRVLRSHAVRGERLLLETMFFLPGLNRGFWQAAAEIALTHHERINGTGYPAGLAGDALSTTLRLIAFSNAVDAMVGWRHYQDRHSVEQALRTLYEKNREEHEPTGWDVFMRIFSKGEDRISRGFRETLDGWKKLREADLIARTRPALEKLRQITGATGGSEGGVKPRHIGSMTNVYEVRDPLTGRSIAVKVPSSPDVIPTMEKEARVFQLAHAALTWGPGGQVAGFQVPEPVIITGEIRALLPGVDLTHATAYDYIDGRGLPEHGQMTSEQYAAFRAGLRVLNRNGVFFTDVGVPWGQNIFVAGKDVSIIDGLVALPAEGPEFSVEERAKRAKGLFENQEAVLDTLRSLSDLIPPDPPGADYKP